MSPEEAEDAQACASKKRCRNGVPKPAFLCVQGQRQNTVASHTSVPHAAASSHSMAIMTVVEAMFTPNLTLIEWWRPYPVGFLPQFCLTFPF